MGRVAEPPGAGETHAMKPAPVNLDAIGAFLDRALEHPLAHVARQVVPELVDGVRQVRDNLPDVAAGVLVRTEEHLRGEAQALAGDGVRRAAKSVRAFVDDALVAAGKRPPAQRRLKPARKKR